MPFSTGTFSLYSTGNPVVTGTVISTSWANNTLDDIATGLSTCMLKDGTQTQTAPIPFADATDSTSGTTGSINTLGGIGVTKDVSVGGTLNVAGDTSAGDDASVGYTSVDGIILTGQGSTRDVTIKNDADENVIGIATGTLNVDITGVATASTFEPDGDTTAADNAAIGYTSVDGIVITGQGSTRDVTIKNDADSNVIGIPTGTTDVNITGVCTATTFEPDGDTTAGDNAVIGYTSVDGLVLAGQGSTRDITIKNDADTNIISIPTGTTGVTFAGAITATNGIIFSNETLDQYDEGTFTPVFSDAASGGNDSSTTMYGRYVRVGKVVSVWIRGVNVDTTGMTAGNDAYITALPFTTEATNNIDFAAATSLSSVNFVDTPATVSAVAQHNATVFRWEETKDAAGTDYLIVSEFTSGQADIAVQMTYEIN